MPRVQKQLLVLHRGIKSNGECRPLTMLYIINSEKLEIGKPFSYAYHISAMR